MDDFKEYLSSHGVDLSLDAVSGRDTRTNCSEKACVNNAKGSCNTEKCSEVSCTNNLGSPQCKSDPTCSGKGCTNQGCSDTSACLNCAQAGCKVNTCEEYACKYAACGADGCACSNNSGGICQSSAGL